MKPKKVKMSYESVSHAGIGCVGHGVMGDIERHTRIPAHRSLYFGFSSLNAFSNVCFPSPAV